MKKYLLDNLIIQLGSISRIAAIENANRTEQAIKNLIDMIRYKFGRQEQILRLKDEIEAANNFIEIFKIRFGDILQYDMDIEESCLDLYIPHYTIMTFVENCIYHAFENKEGIKKITSRIYKLNHQLVIKIHDNGIGCYSNEYVEDKTCNKEYGTITSTFDRLCNYYKVQDILKIKSSERKGTLVVINLPLLQ
ncbi:sensor histidine kinase [Crassaminicella profunda]|uniref:sensor histidine kinase n=1 Tax=Crassaminicella profunda TaxID=1286698 RepID=UPI001CA68908|nr:histidine kinase [Crassaminicella profunda]QZY54677.1 histidine kinase [Crassaminicella profunda]